MTVLTRNNRILAAFGEDGALVLPYLRETILQAGQVLCEAGAEIEFVYFLHHGAVSKLTLFADGSEIECALVGREGAIGASAALGMRRSLTRDICHLPAMASRLDVDRLRDACRSSVRIHDVMDRYCVWKMCSAIRNGACNARHPVEQRLCRWLLTCSDVLEQDAIALPQEVLAKMLGVQRTSVNPILQSLKAAGIVHLGRSRVVIRDRERLKARACECYGSCRTDSDIFGSWRTAPPRPGFVAAGR